MIVGLEGIKVRHLLGITVGLIVGSMGVFVGIDEVGSDDGGMAMVGLADGCDGFEDGWRLGC